MKKQFIRAASLAVAAASFGVLPARAGTVTNADTSATLNLGSSWVGGVVPGSSSVAVWDGTVQNNLAKTLGAAASWLGIQELNPAGPVTIGADGNSLTLGLGGIDLSLATNGLTLDNPVVLSGTNQTWQVTNGMTLTLAGAVSGSSRLTLNNGGSNVGTIALTVANTYTGGTVINSGVVVPYVVTSFGTAGVTNNGGSLLLNNFTHSGVMVNSFYVTGTSLIDMANEGTSYVFDGAWSGSGTILVTNDTGSGSTLTFGGASGGNMANFTGSIVVVTNASGTPSAGTLRLNNGGSQVNTGNAGMAINLGATNSTVRLSNRDPGTTSVGELTGCFGTTVTGQTSGNGTEIWSIGGRNTSVTFGGAFVNQGSAALAALTKVGTGTFTLTGTNTFTGPITINAGALQIGDGGADGVLGGGAIVNNASLVFDRADNTTVIPNNISGSGSLIFEADATNTLNGADTSSGPTIISQGDLIVGASGSISGPIAVGGGSTLDVSQISFSLNQTLSGDGFISGQVTAIGGSINPGGSGTNGTLTFLTGLTENGNVNNQFALSHPGGSNDLINVTGPLTLSGTNYIALSAFGGGTIPAGTYPLFTYTGTLTGGPANFAVTAVGVTGTLTNITSTTPPEIAVIVAAAARGATNLFWKGDGVANNWDTTSSNWFNGPTAFNFQAGDSAIFNNAAGLNTNVNVALAVAPAAVLVSNTIPYVFSGPGAISGSTGLTKTNSGSLAIFNTNSYTGPTVIGGGSLVVNNLANGGSSSAIGAAISNPTNVVLYNSTLVYDGSSAATDRGMTLNGASDTFDVTNGVNLTLNGVLTGPGALTQVDSGTLTLANVNTYAGGTLLANGVLALGNNNANNNGTGGSALGSTNNPVTFNGGTLKLYGAGQSTANNYNNFFNTLVVPAGQSGTLQMFPRGPINTGGGSGLTCTLTGAGTLNLVVNYVRDALSGNWSAFTGVINVTDASPSDTVAADNEFRINNTYGLSNATVNLNGTLLMDYSVAAGATVNIGSLNSVSTAVIGRGSSSAGSTTWSVGWLNTTATFAGVIEDDSNNSGNTSVTKVGTGTWYLQGQNTYSGSTIISNGVLALAYNPTNGTDGSISVSTNIIIEGGAALDLSGTLNDSDTLYLAANQVLGGYGTLRGALDNTGGGIVTGGGGLYGGTGVLTVTNQINLGGGGFAWMKVSRGASPNSDRLVSSTAGTISFGGTLIVTNIGPALHVGDTFTLFSAPSLQNTFSTVVLPDYYTWNTANLYTSGQISVTGMTAPPRITSVDFSQLQNGQITLNSTGGLANGAVTVLTTTNLALPVSAWTPAVSGNYDGSGNLNIQVPVNQALFQSYFILQSN